MEASELRELTPDELLRRLEDVQKELLTLRLRVAGQLPNTTRVRALRRDVARIKTLLGQKGVKA
jgi:large subunit ribosomal protein L29